MHVNKKIALQDINLGAPIKNKVQKIQDNLFIRPSVNLYQLFN